MTPRATPWGVSVSAPPRCAPRWLRASRVMRAARYAPRATVRVHARCASSRAPSGRWAHRLGARADDEARAIADADADGGDRDPWARDVGPGLLPSAVVANVGAFLFGYHTAVCNAPLAAMAHDLGFASDDGLKGIVVSALVVGGAVGGLSVGGFSDGYGRKAALMAASAPLVAGALVSAWAPSAWAMIAGRFITGLGVGASSQIVPLYLSEISPPALRGTLNGFRRLAYVFGCLAAFCLAAPLKDDGGEGWWRPLFSDAAVPAAALAIGAYFIAQESPVWLLTQGEDSARESRRSLAALQNIRGRAAVAWQNGVKAAAARARPDEGTDEINDGNSDAIAQSADAAVGNADAKGKESLSGWAQLFSEEKNRLPLTIGLGLCSLAAFSGSNTVIFYASTVFTQVGIVDPNILTWAVGIPNVAGGFIALALSDRMGRRPLLLASFGGMATCLGLLATAAYLTPSTDLTGFCADPALGKIIDVGLSDSFSYSTSASARICADLGSAAIDSGPDQPEAAVALVTIPLYVLFFSLGAGPIPWLLYNEVFPTRIRARAVSMCTALNYAANSVVGATFLPMVSATGLSGSYGLYAVLCACGYVFVDRNVPETKGYKLEEIEDMLLAKRRGSSS